MPEKNNKVKIAVDSEEKENKKKPGQGAQREVSAKSAKANGKQSGSTRGGVTNKNKSKRQNGSPLGILLAALITALIVGGAIYTWQKDAKQDLNDKLSQEARSTRMSFEQRIENLKEKITSIESEKENIKKTAKELEEKTKLLMGAKKEYSNEEYGISFEYPAVFGEISVKEVAGATGTKMIGEFKETDKVYFGGAAQSFQPKSAATGTAQSFTETLGYEQKEGDYYFRTPKGSFKIDPAEIIELADGGEALLLDRASFTSVIEGDNSPVDIGGNLGAVINIEAGEYSGISFINSDFGVMPQEDFKNMIESIGM